MDIEGFCQESHDSMCFFFQAEDGIRDYKVTGVQTCALPISSRDLPSASPLSTPRTREYIENGEAEGKSLLDAMRDGKLDGMQDFDTVIRDFIEDRKSVV